MELRGIEPETTERWLAENVPGLRTPVTFSLVSGGRSNLTYQVIDADGVVRALRRPPTGGVLTTAHDMSREWRFISALHGTDVPVPEPLAFCDDESVTGAEFYVMGFVDGHVLAGPDSAESFSPAARRRAGLATVECMAALHGVDPDEVGLGDAARRDGYLERQLRRWQRQVHQSGAPDLPLLDAVHDALLAKVPRQETGIVHGDFRPGNLSFSPDGDVLAVFDWELATLGEPLADLGWLLATWVEPGDELPPATALGPTAEPGFPTRAELIDRYVALSGRDASELPYYVAFQRWRSCCISAGVRARYLAGVMGDDGYVAESRAKNELRQAEAAWQAVQELS
ncbi:phosphotransferase family protein [Saccharopolyspora sp. NPDC050389]|uniref:phosphotransferase family protein n=1 Tax=Saccharopolyspora sp. NPDC050389 TaxID=3155516 RepID=UPI0033DD1148